MPAKTKDKGGRPTVMTPKTIDKLEAAFSLGATDEEACLYAGIGTTTLENYQKAVPEFLGRKRLLKQRPILMARKSVIKGLEDDHDHALRFLKARKKDEFGDRVEHTGADGEAIKGQIVYVPKEIEPPRPVKQIDKPKNYQEKLKEADEADKNQEGFSVVE